MSEAAPPRGRGWRAWRGWHPDPVVVAVLAVAVVALVLRVVDLGERAMHHDESLHALYSWYLVEGRGYEHNPLMHGPFQFHVIAAFFALFGDSDVVSRLPSALAGTALVASPLLLRRWLGTWGVVTAAVLLAISPSLLYYSRFSRNDLFMAVWAVLMVASVWRYLDDGRLRWLLVLAGALSLSFATKENIYLAAAVLLLYLDVRLAWRWAGETGRAGLERWGRAALLAPVAWALAALHPLLARAGEAGGRARTREGDLLVVTGTLTLTQLGAAVQVPLTLAGYDVSGDFERQVGIVTVSVLLAAAAVVGLLWDWRRWALCFALFAVIHVPLYTTFFTNPEGIAGGVWNSLDYWLAQQEVERGSQPWFYYLMMLPIYELLALVPALVGGAWLVRRGEGLAVLLAWWFLGTLLLLSYAGEKMPWLTVHLALPLALLAALAVGRAVPRLAPLFRAGRGPALAWAGAGASAAVAVVLLLFTLRTGVAVSYAHPDTPIEPLIFTQTTPEVPRLAEEVIAALESGEVEQVLVDQTASLTWPWAWYLRGRDVLYTDAEYLRSADLEGPVVVIAATSTLPQEHPLRERSATVIEYRHRWWFPQFGADDYGAITRDRFLERLRDGSLVEDWMDFLIGRVEETRLGSTDGEVLFVGTGEAGDTAREVGP